MKLGARAAMVAFAFMIVNSSLGEVSASITNQNAPLASGAYLANIHALTRANTAYRRVLSTAKRMQVVVMSIPPDGDVGEERHERVEQILVAVEGEGTVIVNGVASPFRTGDMVFLRPGAKHNFINTGKTPLKLFTIYSPPNHLPGRVHATKADAQADVEDEAFGAHVQ